MYQRAKSDEFHTIAEKARSIAERYSLPLTEVSDISVVHDASVEMCVHQAKVSVRRVTLSDQRDTGRTGGRARGSRIKSRGLEL